MKANEDIEISAIAIIHFLEKRGQLPFLGKIIQRLQVLEQKSKVAFITSPTPLSPQELSLVKKYLTKLGETDLEIKNLVDEKIEGGLVIKIGDRVLDLSLKEQINQLKEKLTE